MLKIKARKLLQYTTEELWDKLEGEFIIIFDNGEELVTNEKSCIFSSYAWDFHRKYIKTPLLKHHHVGTIIGNSRLSSNTHLQLIGNALWSVYDVYAYSVPDRVKLLDDLAKLAYDVINHLYNELSYRLEEYVTSIDILDFLEVTDHPALLKVMCEMKPTQESITGVYTEIKSLLRDENNFKENALAKAVRSSIVDINQVMQCIGPRGLLTDIDSFQFNMPVMRGYVHGIRSLYDSMIESRSAAKSLAFSTDPLQKSEYFSRRQQLICQNVKHLHMGDCGSTNYLPWHVRDERYEGSIKISSSDLTTIVGKYYLDEETNTLKIVQKTDTHLMGKTIKLRSVVSGCMHPDPYGVCEVCFGEISLAVPANTNIGHAACVCMTEMISQIVLSTKHLDNSAVIEGIVLKPYEKKFLSAPVNGNTYYLSDDLKNKKVRLILNSTDISGITDVNLVDDVESLNISRVSEFNEIILHITDNMGDNREPLTVNVNRRSANLTHQMLNYIKMNGWSILKDGKYEFDLSNWDFKQPIFSLPMRDVNMGDHQVEIADMLESTVKQLTYRDSVVSPSAMIIEFHDLVNRRLSVNLAILEIVLYGSMVVSAANGDYSLPKPWTTSGIGVMRLLLNHRSLAPEMAYERHKDSITAPSNYTNINRMDHPFDSLVCSEALTEKMV